MMRSLCFLPSLPMSRTQGNENVWDFAQLRKGGRLTSKTQTPLNLGRRGRTIRATAGDEGGTAGDDISWEDDQIGQIEESSSNLDISSTLNMSALLQQVADLRQRQTQLAICVLDSIVPGQKLEFSTQEPRFVSFVQRCVEQLEPQNMLSLGSFGMCGMDMNGEMLPFGTEVEIAAYSHVNGTTAVTLVGKRLFRLAAHEDSQAFLSEGLPLYDVEWVKSEDAYNFDDELAEAARDLLPLVEEWKDLVVRGGHERFSHHIDHVLMDLGRIPCTTQPRELAMWVAALINPLPALGVAYEIRPMILATVCGYHTDVSDRDGTTACVRLAAEGIRLSIAHLDGTRPMA